MAAAASITTTHCTDVTVHDRLSTPLYDMLCVSIRPFYLPSELTKIIVCVWYNYSNKGQIKDCCVWNLKSEITSLQSKYPKAPVLAMDDLNASCLLIELPSLHQYVNISMHLHKTLDVCYGSIADAYSCIPLPKLGRSDHQTVYLCPKYKTPSQTSTPASLHCACLDRRKRWGDTPLFWLNELLDPNTSFD